MVDPSYFLNHALEGLNKSRERKSNSSLGNSKTIKIEKRNIKNNSLMHQNRGIDIIPAMQQVHSTFEKDVSTSGVLQDRKNKTPENIGGHHPYNQG